MKRTVAFLASGFLCLMTAAIWQRATGGVRPGINHAYDFVGVIGLMLLVLGVIFMFLESTRALRKGGE